MRRRSSSRATRERCCARWSISRKSSRRSKQGTRGHRASVHRQSARGSARRRARDFSRICFRRIRRCGKRIARLQALLGTAADAAGARRPDQPLSEFSQSGSRPAREGVSFFAKAVRCSIRTSTYARRVPTRSTKSSKYSPGRCSRLEDRWHRGDSTGRIARAWHCRRTIRYRSGDLLRRRASVLDSGSGSGCAGTGRSS